MRINLRAIALFAFCAFAPACAERRAATPTPPREVASVTQSNSASPLAQSVAPPSHFDAPRININTATRAELMRLPGIGAGLAERILEHRARYGRFRRPAHLMMVNGIGARRFEKLQQFVSVE